MQGSITFNQRFKWMWVDEYTWAFLYNENIDIRDNSQGFRLAKKTDYEEIYQDDSVEKVVEIKDKTYFLTTDWMLVDRNNNPYIAYDTAEHWALLTLPSWGITTMIVVGNHIGLFSDQWRVQIPLNDIENIYWNELISNNTLTDATGWTAWAWWSFWAGGATHTTGNTDTLAININTTNPWDNRPHVRLNLSINDWTAWSLTVSWATSLPQTKGYKDWLKNLIFWLYYSSTGSKPITITPSSDFDGTIVYATAKQITSSSTVIIVSPRPAFAVYSGGTLYHTYSSSIRALDTTVNPRANLTLLSPWAWERFERLTESWGYLYAYANAGNYCVKYIRDGTSNFADGKITYQGGKFISIKNDGNIDYVVMDENWYRSLYAMSGYEKDIILRHKITNNTLTSKKQNIKDRLKINKLWAVAWGIIYATSGSDVLSFGSDKIGFPRAFSREYNIEGKEIIDVLDWVNYLAVDSENKTSWIISVNDKQFSNSWYILTTPMIIGGLGREKVFDKVRIGMKLPNENTRVNIYVNANDSQYFTFYSDTEPNVWDKLTKGNNEFEVVSISGRGYFTCIALIKESDNDEEYILETTGTLTDGTNNYIYTDYDNFIHLKTYNTDRYKYTHEYILSSDLVRIGIQNVYKMILKVELVSTDPNVSPEVNDITVLSTVLEDGF